MQVTEQKEDFHVFSVFREKHQFVFHKLNNKHNFSQHNYLLLYKTLALINGYMFRRLTAIIGHE